MKIVGEIKPMKKTRLIILILLLIFFLLLVSCVPENQTPTPDIENPTNGEIEPPEEKIT